MSTASPRGVRRRVLIAGILGALAIVSCWKVDADLKLSTHTLDFGTSHDEATFTVTNDSQDNALTTGVTLLDYTLKADRPWVTISPASGRCGGQQSETHTVKVDRSGLPQGQSLATITASSNGGSDHINIRVVMGSGGGGCSDPPTPPSDPSPADSATGVGLDDDLSWQGGESQCEGSTATYDVYFGTSNPPPFHHNSGEKKTFNPGRMAANTTFYWRIVATDQNHSTGGRTWRFHTEAGACTEPLTALALASPADGATGVAQDANLSWTGGESQCDGHTSTYDVYFGTSSSPPLRESGVSGKSYDPGPLDAGTTYYWQIHAGDGISERTSSTRSFTTAAAPCTTGPSELRSFSPANGNGSVGVDDDLAWSGGDSQCPGQTATYDVYFGTASPPPYDHNNGTSKRWDPGTLQDRQTYYWKIVAKDDKGTRSSAVLTFTTVCHDDNGASLTTPCTPSPPDGKENFNPKGSISWGCGVTTCDEHVTYTFYLGTSSDLGADDIVTTTTSRTVKPPSLRGGTTYYWKVVAHAGSTDRPGPVWRFKTKD